MLRPAHLSHSRNQSLENNTPCPPPYNQTSEDVYSGQNSSSARRVAKEQAQDFEDDLLAQVDHIHDPVVLRRLLIQKEQERLGLATNLDLAARLGLDLHQQMQQMEHDSYSKFQSLQDENLALQSKANQSQELSYQLAESENEVKELTGHNRFLQRELDSCRQELKAFRKELDELSEQMAEMGVEMVEAKTKVNSYARRLGEVEQELSATHELNVNLQVQLENALQKQKQTYSSTTQAVKLIQSDLGKVFSDSDTMRLTLEELESRQMNCEGKVLEMMTNTREYAQLLEEAQETITSMRIESDLEGQNWAPPPPRGSQAVIWDEKTGTPPLPPPHHRDGNERSSPTAQMGATVKITDESGEYLRNLPSLQEELDPQFDYGDWNQPSGMGNSLGSELEGFGQTLGQELEGFSRGLDQELNGFPGGLDQELNGAVRGWDQELQDSEESRSFDEEIRNAENQPSTETTASSTAPHQEHQHQHHVTFEDTPDLEEPVKVEHRRYHSTLEHPTEPAGEELKRTNSSSSTPVLPQRLSLSAELHQRLEENNILQTVLSGTSRASWHMNATATVLSTMLMSPTQQRSPNAIRDVGMGLSLASMTARSSSSPNHRNYNHGSSSSSSTPLPSPSMRSGAFQESLSSDSSSPSIHSGHNNTTTTTTITTTTTGTVPDSGGSPSITKTARSQARSGIAVETQNSLGLKYLLSATSSADLSNVITKAKAAAPPTNTTKARSNSVGRSARSHSPSGKGRNGTNNNATNTISKDGRTRTGSVSSFSSSSISTSGRTTPTKPIAVPTGRPPVGGGRKSTASPASSWSSSSFASYMTMSKASLSSATADSSQSQGQRRPSLPPLPIPSSFTPSTSSTPTSGGTPKPRPHWT